MRAPGFPSPQLSREAPMKTIHVPVQATIKISLPQAFLKKLPSPVGLFMTTQYISQINEVKFQLESASIAVSSSRLATPSCLGSSWGAIFRRFQELQDLSMSATAASTPSHLSPRITSCLCLQPSHQESRSHLSRAREKRAAKALRTLRCIQESTTCRRAHHREDRPVRH